MTQTNLVSQSARAWPFCRRSSRRGAARLLLVASALAAVAWAAGVSARAADRPSTAPAARADGQTAYSATRPSADGIGKVYMGREIAQVMGHLGAGWLERPEREREEQPRKAIEMMGLKPTDVVADIGAGSGYFSFRIAAKVPEGEGAGRRHPAGDARPGPQGRQGEGRSPTSSRCWGRKTTRSCPRRAWTWC